MASSSDVARTSDVKPPASQSPEIDDEKLRARAEACNNKGDKEYEKEEYFNAIDCYTEGIMVNCKDKNINAILFTNRANAHFRLGGYHEALSDAKAARKFEATYTKAIERGARACVKLNLCEEAITWCDEALATDPENTTLLEIRNMCLTTHSSSVHLAVESSSEVVSVEVKIPHELKSKDEVLLATTKRQAYRCLGFKYSNLGDFRKALQYHQLDLGIARNIGDRVREGCAYSDIGLAYNSLGDFKKAIANHQLSLEIAKEVGDRSGEGKAYANLGIAHDSLGDFKKAVEYHLLHLSIAKEFADRAGEGKAYANLGVACLSLGDFEKALEYHQLDLNISKEVEDRGGEGKAYSNLGLAYHFLGDFRKALKFHKQALDIAKDVGDKTLEGCVYSHLGLTYCNLGDFEEAIECHQEDLSIAEEIGDNAGRGKAYANLGITYLSIGNFRKALEYNQLHLTIAEDVGDRDSQGSANANIGEAYFYLGDFQKAIEYHQQSLSIAKEIGKQINEGREYSNLGQAYLALGDVREAEDNFKQSVKVFDEIRNNLHSRDESKISLRNLYRGTYTALWMVQLQQNKIVQALFTAERGRGQALMDLMESKYGFRMVQPEEGQQMKEISDIFKYISSPTVFLAIAPNSILYWVLEKGNKIIFLQNLVSEEDLQGLSDKVYQEIGVLKSVKCENRSFDELENENSEESTDRGPDEDRSTSSDHGKKALKILYDVAINPIIHLIDGDEVTIVPDGPLLLAPFAALMDERSRYLSESLRIRLVPSLTSLQLIAECPEGYHGTTGALLVGDPWVESVRVKKKKVKQLPSAKKEVEIIGKILKIDPLTGERATKAEVLSRLNSVALVHIAAHGCPETGEIILSPNPTKSNSPKEEDFLLTMADVLNAKLQARLVVLSCCHSGRGEIKAEGVVGIARAFLGAGARSVLVSLWAISDEATVEFMRKFYKHMVEGQSASKSLNQAMKWMRESEKFSEVRYWAPFVLIGDDVTLTFGQTSDVSASND